MDSLKECLKVTESSTALRWCSRDRQRLPQARQFLKEGEEQELAWFKRVLFVSNECGREELAVRQSTDIYSEKYPCM